MKTNRTRLNLVLLSLILLGVSACKKTESTKPIVRKQDVFGRKDTTKIHVENPKLIAYRAFVAALDSTDMTVVVAAMEEYKRSFKAESQSLCDSAYAIFQAKYDVVEGLLNMSHQNDTTDYSPLFQKGGVVPAAVKSFQLNLQKNGFKLSSAGGATYIEVDRNFVSGNFYSMISPSFKMYLDEIQKENKEGFAIDEVITISYRQLVDRIIWYENFIAENPGSVMLDNCRNYKKAYLTYLLTGYGKTALYSNSQTAEVAPYYAKAFKYLMDKYPESEVAVLITPYLEALKQKKTNDAQAVLKDLRIKGMILTSR